jgi:hypothetical protein
MHERQKIYSQSLANHKGSLRLRWGAHKEPDLSRSKTSWTITKIQFSFPLSNPHQGEGNTNFSRFTTTLVTPGQHLVRLGDKSSRETNKHRSSMKCLLDGWVGHSREWLKSLLGSLDWREAWGREVLISRRVGSKCIQEKWVANRAEGEGGLL